MLKSTVCITENFALPENTRSCWPVRPIPRRSYLQDAVAHEAQNANNAAALLSTNAAIGVVIPTTPNSTLHQQQNQLNEQLLQHNQQLLSMRVPDGAPQPVTRNVTGPFNNDKSVHMEDRLSQIQDYIRITTSLIDSINAEQKVGNCCLTFAHLFYSVLGSDSPSQLMTSTTIFYVSEIFYEVIFL